MTSGDNSKIDSSKSSSTTNDNKNNLTTPTKKLAPIQEEKKSEEPSTPGGTTRRSARVHKRDPIIAPGFGTQKDINQLSKDLGLPVDACKAIMESRGRGIRSSRRKDDEEGGNKQVPATPISTAWADFMMEEGFGGSGAGASSTDAAAPKTSKSAKKDLEEASSKALADDSNSEPGGERSYVLPLKPKWLSDDDDEPVSKKRKSTSEDEGMLVQTGSLDAACVGRTKRKMDRPYDLFLPTLIMPSVRFKKVITGCNATHSIAISTDGIPYGWGRNESQQLTSDLDTNVALPTELKGPFANNIVDGAVGKSHTILLDANGQLWSVGSNKCGQCGIKSSTEQVQNFRKCVILGDDIKSKSKDRNIKIVQVSCGEDFTVALCTNGYMYTTGSSEFGQLGNGETGEYFVSANKLAYANCNVFTRRSVFVHVPGEKNYGIPQDKGKAVPLDGSSNIRLSHVACGKHHTIVVEAPSTSPSAFPPRVFSFGCGDYGCLGHGVQADEYQPRMIGFLSTGNLWNSNPPVTASAGSNCSMVLTEKGHVYYWGKHRSVGEATMRPAVLEALANNGHIVTHCDGGSQTVFCSTANAVTVSWGQGPHGELGYGDKKKSSSKPDFVTSLDKCRVADLACGYGHTLFILRDEDKADKAALKEINTIDEADLKDL